MNFYILHKFKRIHDNIFLSVGITNSIHIVAQRANRYVVAFCIALSYDIYLSGDSGQATQTVSALKYYTGDQR